MRDANTSQSTAFNLFLLAMLRYDSGYASDISQTRSFGCLYLTLTACCLARTYPASGVFSAPQRDLYAAVLNAQKSLISLCTESAELSLHQLHHKSCDLLRTELNQIGFNLFSGDLERVLYPHFLSHPIGIGMSFFLLLDTEHPRVDGDLQDET